MTRLTAAVGRLTAGEGRQLRGRLLPFGRPGFTNLGRIECQPGDVTVPEDTTRLFAHLDHLDGRDDVARWTGITQEPDGLWATWDVLETHGGDKLLAEYQAGTRRGVSVELEPVTVEDGRAKGQLIGCAFPKRPAFADARLVAEADPAALEAAAQALVAAVGLAWEDLTDELRAEAVAAISDAADAIDPEQQTPPEATDTQPTLTAAHAATTTPVAAAAGTTAPTPATTERHNMTAPAVTPAALLNGTSTPPAITPAATEPARLVAADARPADAYRLMAQIADPTTPDADKARLLAALADITPTSLVGRDQPAWVGQLWQGVSYQRRVVPLLTNKELTGLKVRGWRWVTRPAMAKYAGGKAEIPSSAVLTEEYNEAAQRFAGGNDVDRSYADFRDQEFFEALHGEYANSYAKLTDLYAVEKMKAAALALTMGANPNSLPVGWVAIVDGMLSMLDIGTPSFALVEASVWRDMVLTPQDKFLEFLNAALPASIDGGTLMGQFKIVPVAQANTGTASTTLGLDKGEVLVGTSAAVTFRELGGGTPIRVSALDIAKGGVDEAAFGYAHVDVTDNRGLRLVDTVTDV